MPQHELIQTDKALPLPEKSGASDQWVPAFPTEQVRGLEAHGTTRGKACTSGTTYDTAHDLPLDQRDGTVVEVHEQRDDEADR